MRTPQSGVVLKITDWGDPLHALRTGRPLGMRHRTRGEQKGNKHSRCSACRAGWTRAEIYSVQEMQGELVSIGTAGTTPFEHQHSRVQRPGARLPLAPPPEQRQWAAAGAPVPQLPETEAGACWQFPGSQMPGSRRCERWKPAQALPQPWAKRRPSPQRTGAPAGCWRSSLPASWYRWSDGDHTGVNERLFSRRTLAAVPAGFHLLLPASSGPAIAHLL